MKKLNRLSTVAALALTLSSISQTTLAQSASENSLKIQELESQLQELRKQNTELAKLIKSMASGQTAPNSLTPLVTSQTVPGEIDIDPATIESEDVETFENQPPLSSFDNAGTDRISTAALDNAANLAFQIAEPIPTIADGGQSTPTRSNLSSVGITANKDGGRVSISLSNSKFKSFFKVGQTETDCTLLDDMTVFEDDECYNQSTRYRQDVMALSFSAPASDSGDTSLATLDALSSGAKAEFRHTFYFGSIPNAREITQNKYIKSAQMRCLVVNKTAEENCTTTDAKFVKKYMSPEDREAYADFVFENTVANSYGLTLTGSIGYKEFSIFPDTQFEKDDLERISKSVGAGLIYFPSRGSSLLFEGQYQRSYKAADTLTRCRPMPDPGDLFLTCATGAFAAPSKKEKFVLTPQYRTQIPLSSKGLIKNIAIAPRFEYDVLSDDYALDIPFYLVSGKKEGMVAGIRLGYENEDDEGDFKVGVFYGKAFDLTPF